MSKARGDKVTGVEPRWSLVYRNPWSQKCPGPAVPSCLLEPTRAGLGHPSRRGSTRTVQVYHGALLDVHIYVVVDPW